MRPEESPKARGGSQRRCAGAKDGWMAADVMTGSHGVGSGRQAIPKPSRLAAANRAWGEGIVNAG